MLRLVMGRLPREPDVRGGKDSQQSCKKAVRCLFKRNRASVGCVYGAHECQQIHLKGKHDRGQCQLTENRVRRLFSREVRIQFLIVGYLDITHDWPPLHRANAMARPLLGTLQHSRINNC
jgi:hypothetical protein